MYKDEIEAFAWRWEFMRRNPQYRQDYQKVQELRGKAEYPPGSTREQTINLGKRTAKIELDSYHDTPEYRKEREICGKYGLSEMIDPAHSLLEILQKKDLSSAQMVVDWTRALWILHSSFEQPAISVRGDFEKSNERVWIKEVGDFGFRQRESGFSRLRIYIDFTKVNSLSELKSTLSSELDKHFSNYAKKKRKSTRKQKYPKDYMRTLTVGEMKEKGELKNKEIAKIIFPNDVDEQSAIRKILLEWKKYRDLINGGYKNITYP